MIASLCTIQMPFIVTQICLILLEKSPAVRSWIQLDFLNISVGFSKYKLNSDWIPSAGSPREVRGSNPSGGPFSQYFENFKNSILLITFARGKVIAKWDLQGWPPEDEESDSDIKNTFYFLSSSATVRTHTCVLFCFGAFSSGLSLALKLRWPKLGLQGKH